MVELESQEAVETMRVATAAHVRTSVTLRLLAFAASLVAAVVVVTNRQDRWGITVSFEMFAVWEAFVAINFACAAYTVLTALFLKKLIKVHIHCCCRSMQLTVNLQTAATAGAGAVGSVAMWGNKPSGWFAVCRLYRLYCDKGAVSLALASVAFVALGVASTLSRFPRAPPPASR
ncbi:CASP-like protein UU-1 [Phragmites australis]|uniref:CASP-like protein UU-1 n=1 Tax=Phragmites australis TaxID=29695 RepID=UPI002D79DEE4|nr:CASP-like protein UU-1 [Phragmites australis]